MKIAYILEPKAMVAGDSSGVKKQALLWKAGLNSLSHEVHEINSWDCYNWNEFDIIHIFGTGLWLPNLVQVIYRVNKNIVVSPIIDSIQKPLLYKLSTYIGLKRARLWSPTYALKNTLPFLKGVFVRSEYEANYFSYSMNLRKENIYKVPVTFDIPLLTDIPEKENFCLHVSSLYQDRKNVKRLVQAAKKYDFHLVLAGSVGQPDDFKKIEDEIGQSSNIEVLGFISDEKLLDLYKRAKTFALPSIMEGVGIVALEAAAYGCEVVITNIGGPKEYYGDLVYLINPYDIDDIGSAIKKSLSGNGFQPHLKEYIIDNYTNIKACILLEQYYTNIKEK